MEFGRQFQQSHQSRNTDRFIVGNRASQYGRDGIVLEAGDAPRGAVPAVLPLFFCSDVIRTKKYLFHRIRVAIRDVHMLTGHAAASTLD